MRCDKSSLNSERGVEDEEDRKRRGVQAHLDIGLLVQETLGCCGEAERHTLRWKSTHHTPSNDRRSLGLFTPLQVQRARRGCGPARPSVRAPPTSKKKGKKKKKTPPVQSAKTLHVRTFSTLNGRLGKKQKAQNGNLPSLWKKNPPSIL